MRRGLSPGRVVDRQPSELGAYCVPHTVIADNLGGHLMQRRQVNLVLAGSDRTTSTGDVQQASPGGSAPISRHLAARDNEVPFYVAIPMSTIDWSLADGRLDDISRIEERSPAELLKVTGMTSPPAHSTPCG